MRDGLVAPAQAVEGVAQIAEEAGVARSPAHGLGEQRQRRFQPACLGMEHTVEMQRVGMAGPLLQDPFVERRRCRRAARPMMVERRPQHDVDGIGAGRCGAGPPSFRPPPLAPRHCALLVF